MNALQLFASIIAWLAIAVSGWLAWQLLRQNGRILLRLDELDKRLNELEFGEENEEPAGLPVGSDAPPFESPDLFGHRKSLTQYRGQPVMLVFFNPACGFCRELVPRLGELTPVYPQPSTLNPQPLTLLIVTTGDAETNRALFDEHKLGCPVLLQSEQEVARAYQAHGTPSGYLISPEGKIASELAMGAEALLALVDGKAKNGKLKAEINSGEPAPAAGNGNGDERAHRFSHRSLSRSKIKRDGLKAGSPAPDFRLPRLDGHGELALSKLHGSRVLLVFSSPTCGPCATLAPELEKFHRQHSGVEIVMISKGEPKENRAKVKEHGLTFPIVLQQQWEISRRYAMFATPIAYLIDETGIIVHDVAVGTDAILGLLDKRDEQDVETNRMEVKDVGLVNEVPV